MSQEIVRIENEKHDMVAISTSMIRKTRVICIKIVPTETAGTIFLYTANRAVQFAADVQEISRVVKVWKTYNEHDIDVGRYEMTYGRFDVYVSTATFDMLEMVQFDDACIKFVYSDGEIALHFETGSEEADNGFWKTVMYNLVNHWEQTIDEVDLVM